MPAPHRRQGRGCFRGAARGAPRKGVPLHERRAPFSGPRWLAQLTTHPTHCTPPTIRHPCPRQVTKLAITSVDGEALKPKLAVV